MSNDIQSSNAYKNSVLQYEMNSESFHTDIMIQSLQLKHMICNCSTDIKLEATHTTGNLVYYWTACISIFYTCKT